MKKTRRKWTYEQKRQFVHDFESGLKTAKQIADEIGDDPNVVYRWRAQLAERAKGLRIEELESTGLNSESAKKVLQLEAQIEEYQKKVAEQALIIDLLKKLQTSAVYQPENELSWLIDNNRRLGRYRKPVK